MLLHNAPVHSGAAMRGGCVELFTYGYLDGLMADMHTCARMSVLGVQKSMQVTTYLTRSACWVHDARYVIHTACHMLDVCGTWSLKDCAYELYACHKCIPHLSMLFLNARVEGYL